MLFSPGPQTIVSLINNSLIFPGEWGCIDEALSIAAMLQVDNVFVKPSGGQESVKAKVSRRNNFEVIINIFYFRGKYLKLMRKFNLDLVDFSSANNKNTRTIKKKTDFVLSSAK